MEKIWLSQYPASVPAEIDPDKFPSLVEMFLESCHAFADKPAFSNFNVRLSYREVEQLTRDFAAYLQNVLNCKKGDRFAIMLPNTLQYPIALFGALRAGMTIVNVNPLYTADELRHQLSDAGVHTIIVLSNFAHVLQQALPDTAIKNVIITELGDLFPFAKRCLAYFVLHYIKKHVPTYVIPSALSFRNALVQGKKETLKPVALHGEDIAFLQYTGGTTGLSKGAILTHRNMVANVEQAAAWIRGLRHDGNEIMVTALPLYHIFSLTANCLTFFRFGAMNLLITNPRDLDRFIAEIRNAQFTAITGVNTLFNALLHHPKFREVDFSRLHFTLGGGMAVQEAVAKKWQNVTGVPLLEAYGLTETSPAVCINPMELDHYNGSIGLPISSTSICIKDDNDEELPLNTPGELCVKGPQVMRGYWNREEETQKVFTKDGWLRTGDIGFIDENGFAYIVDRKKDMILVSGFNVYPNEIEDILVKNPMIKEAAVIGVPNQEAGEAVKAFIVKNDPTLTADTVITYCRKHLTGYKIPKLIEFVSELPKTNVGKISRRELREQSCAPSAS